MKLAVIGSRGLDNIDLSSYIDELEINVSLIISGGAKGVDSLAENYADEYKLSKYIIRPDYASYGKSAPLVRNKDILCFADMVLVFWDNKSKSTKWSIDFMIKNNINYKLYTI